MYEEKYTDIKQRRFPLISGHLFSTPDNSNLFQFSGKIRVISCRLYDQSLCNFIKLTQISLFSLSQVIPTMDACKLS